MRRVAFAMLTACGSDPHHAPADAPPRDDAPSLVDASTQVDAAALTDALADAKVPDAVTQDAFPAVLDVHINCHNTCTLVAMPSSINVSAGTGFEVNWINTGDTECDVSKVDSSPNHVPIIIGLQPGTNYHDPVHTWCGAIFTGTFQFRVDICTLPSYIPVNCGA